MLQEKNKNKILRGVRVITPLIVYTISINIFLYSLVNIYLPEFVRGVYKLNKIATREFNSRDLLGFLNSQSNNKQQNTQRESNVSDSINQQVTLSQNPKVGEPLGYLRINSIGIDTLVFKGDSPKILAKGAGTSTYTKLPGKGGNCVVSGHRDTTFRKLGKVKVGDTIEFETGYGTFKYKVTKIRIVGADDRTVVVNKNKDMLTIYTCYPFNYIGHAPQRFVVEADRVN